VKPVQPSAFVITKASSSNTTVSSVQTGKMEVKLSLSLELILQSGRLYSMVLSPSSEMVLPRE
jgi:hypothetical protein